jgi:hypothetical protein
VNQLNHKLRVVMLGDYPLDNTQIRGGVQAVLAYLVKGLSQIEDVEVHVVRFRPKDWFGPDQKNQGGVTVHFLPPFPPFERLRNFRTYQANLNARLVSIQPDVVHAQDATANSS